MSVLHPATSLKLVYVSVCVWLQLVLLSSALTPPYALYKPPLLENVLSNVLHSAITSALRLLCEMFQLLMVTSMGLYIFTPILVMKRNICFLSNVRLHTYRQSHVHHYQRNTNGDCFRCISWSKFTPTCTYPPTHKQSEAQIYSQCLITMVIPGQNASH